MKNRIGEKYGRLEIISFDKVIRNLCGSLRYYWNCKCSCGNIKSINYYALGRTINSCGCIAIEETSKRFTTHGHSKNGKITTEFQCYRSMVKRCTNPNTKSFKYYGAKGITVCDRWLESFENFIEDMGMKPSIEYSIDRIDNNLGYFKNNCRWATRIEQANNKTNNKKVINIITNEEYSSISAAAKILKINKGTLYAKLKNINPNNTNLKIKTND